jgi:hypothetical protein
VKAPSKAKLESISRKLVEKAKTTSRRRQLDFSTSRFLSKYRLKKKPKFERIAFGQNAQESFGDCDKLGKLQVFVARSDPAGLIMRSSDSLAVINLHRNFFESLILS